MRRFAWRLASLAVVLAALAVWREIAAFTRQGFGR